MKKIIAFTVLLAMCIMAFAACANEPANTTSSIDKARQYINTMYKDSSEKTPKSFKLMSIVNIDGKTFDVEWTAEVKSGPADGVTIVPGNDGTTTIQLNEAPEEELRYTITANLKDGEETRSVSFEHYVPAVKKVGGIEVVKELAEGVAYKFALNQVNLGKMLYFSGVMSGNYLATSENAADAVDVFVEAVEGGYRLYMANGEEKTYIDLYEYTEGKAGIRLTAEPTAVFEWNSELHLFQTKVAGDYRYLGTYNTYNTMSASSTTYISGDKAANIGVSQFPAQFYTVSLKTTVVEAPAAETAYKFALNQVNLEKTLYFSGVMSGNYLATTTDASKAADVFVETVEGGYRLYMVNGEEKTYIDLYEYTAGKAGIRLTAEPTAVFEFDSELHIFKANVAGDYRYLGTYNTYNTMSASSTTYISGDKAANIGVSQFPSYLVTVGVE